MKRWTALLFLLLLGWTPGDAGPPQPEKPGNKNIGPPSSGFPRTVRVRLWYLHPPGELKLRAEAGQARLRTCVSCADTPLTSLALRAIGERIRLNAGKNTVGEVRVTGAFRLGAASTPPVRADFPVEVRAIDSVLQITATMPMDEYIAGVLAGEVGNFGSDEAIKAMAVAARTYAMHFGSRHALEGFDLCDTTHCQDLRIAGIDPRLRKIAEATAGEVLWYEGEPAATYYHANCGGTTEDGRFILGNDEAPAPYLKQHSDVYCVRNGVMQWRSEVSKSELQRALVAGGIRVPGTLRFLSVFERTPSGRVEFLRISGTNGTATVPGLAFRAVIGRYVGWDRLKSNWYEISISGDRVLFRGRGSGHGVGLCQVGAEIMGEEGKSYRQILAYYYPGTKLGITAQGGNWQQLSGENLQMLTTRPQVDREYLPLASKLAHEVEQSTGLVFRDTPRWKVFPTVAMFRDTTGEPGWIAATTRGRTMQTQPPEVLRQAGTLESTLRHELLHMLIEFYARNGTPGWFREGLVLYLSEPNAMSTGSVKLTTDDLEKTLRAPASEADLRRAYVEAHARVAKLARQYGTQVLILWLQEGLPPEAGEKP